MFWAVSDKAMPYPDRITISFTLIEGFPSLSNIYLRKKNILLSTLIISGASTGIGAPSGWVLEKHTAEGNLRVKALIH